jgi:hypothetical protein
MMNGSNWLALHKFQKSITFLYISNQFNLMLESKLEGKIIISSGKLRVFEPSDGKYFWFKIYKDHIKKNILPPHITQYENMVLANMMNEDYSIFEAQREKSVITIRKSTEDKKWNNPKAIEIYGRVIACCDGRNIPRGLDLHIDRQYKTELANGKYKIKFVNNILTIFLE